MTNQTITPTAIDAYVEIDRIAIVDRHRRDLGDLTSLVDSIKDVGLLNPITVTRELRLVAGQRRLEAIRQIGMDTVPVRFADNLSDAAALLRAERDENVCRKDMTASELYVVGKALEEMERPSAAARQRDAGKNNGRGIASVRANGSYEDGHETREAVGEALGMSGVTWQRLKHIAERAEDGDEVAADTLSKIDSGDESIYRGYQNLREKPPTPRPAPEPKAEPKPEPTSGPDWVPGPTDKGPKPAQRRRELIREMAPGGMTSAQIGDRLGITPQTIRSIAREEGIEIHADKVLGRSHKRIDSNRIIGEIVQDLANTDTSLGLVRFDELDRSQIENWTASLSKSIRMLNRLNKQLKEMVQ